MILSYKRVSITNPCKVGSPTGAKLHVIVRMFRELLSLRKARDERVRALW